MKCINCGAENNADARYCNKCGEKLEYQSYEKTSKNRNFKFIPVIVVAIVIILILLAILIFKNQNLYITINNTDSNKITQESTNSTESSEYKKEYNNNNSSNNINDTNNNVTAPNNIKLRKLNVIYQESTSILTDSFKKDYGPHQVLDGYKSTVWAEGVEGPGYGESITLYLDSVHTVKQLKIVNGLINSSDGYYKNNRVASMTISFPDGTSQIASLSDDNTGYQVINLSQSVETSSITLTIDSVYSGYKYDDTCIAEVVVMGYY